LGSDVVIEVQIDSAHITLAIENVGQPSSSGAVVLPDRTPLAVAPRALEPHRGRSLPEPMVDGTRVVRSAGGRRHDRRRAARPRSRCDRSRRSLPNDFTLTMTRRMPALGTVEVTSRVIASHGLLRVTSRRSLRSAVLSTSRQDVELVTEGGRMHAYADVNQTVTRRPVPAGVKSRKSFGKERRLPIPGLTRG
jgi:hypothetical protein